MKSRWMLGAAVIGILVIVAIIAVVLSGNDDEDDNLTGSVAQQVFPAPTIPGQLNPDTTKVNSVTLAQLKVIIDSEGDKYTIVNVTYGGSNPGNMQGTDTVVTYYDTNGLVAALPDKDAQIIVYSSDVTASRNTALYLLGQGYTAVWHCSEAFTN